MLKFQMFLLRMIKLIVQRIALFKKIVASYSDQISF